jgi:hypothetical protein
MSTALSDGLAFVGATAAFNAGTRTGLVYVFDAATGEQLRILAPPSTGAFDGFGKSIAVYGGKAAVGAPYHDAPITAWDGTPGTSPDAGAIYIFDIATGTQLRYVCANDKVAGSEFGHVVSMYGDTLIVGQPKGTAVTDAGVTKLKAGAAYVFSVSTGAQQARFTAPDPQTDNFFGFSVSVNLGNALIGCPRDEADQDAREREEGSRSRREILSAVDDVRRRDLVERQEQTKRGLDARAGLVIARTECEQQRTHLGHQKRAESQQWQSERDQSEAEYLARARFNKARATATRSRAAKAIAATLSLRKAAATKERDNDYLVTEEKQRILESNRQEVAEIYSKRFASKRAQKEWEESPLGSRLLRGIKEAASALVGGGTPRSPPPRGSSSARGAGSAYSVRGQLAYSNSPTRRSPPSFPDRPPRSQVRV